MSTLPWFSAALLLVGLALYQGLALSLSGTITTTMGMGSREGCESTRPRMVVYNRIPKAGSASVLRVARGAIQASDGRLTEVADSEHFKRRLSPDALHQQAGTLFLPPQQRSQGARLFGSLPEMRLWQGHQFFHDFVGAGDYAGALAVVQVLRDPVDRCVSAFYWNRDRVFNGGRLSPEASEALRDINAWAASPYFSGPPRGIMETPVDVDVRNLPPERDGERQRMLHVWSECNNYQTRWLCGMDDICNAPHSKAALDRALANLREKHAA